MELTPADREHFSSPFDDRIGVRLLSATGDGVVATLQVTDALHQPGGIVHGGVYATLVETTASVGAALWLEGRAVPVGISNHTDFLRSVRDGTLRAEARPVQRGRTMQLWRAEVRDGEDRLIAEGKVRLYNVAVDSRPSAAPAPGAG